MSGEKGGGGSIPGGGGRFTNVESGGIPTGGTRLESAGLAGDVVRAESAGSRFTRRRPVPGMPGTTLARLSTGTGAPPGLRGLGPSRRRLSAATRALS